MPIPTLLTTIAYETGVSISVPQSVTYNDTITAEYKDQPAQRIIEEIANRIDHVAEYDNNMVTFVPKDKAHRDFLMIRSGYVKPEQTRKTLQSMLGSDTTVEVVDDRILVSGESRALELASEYAKHLERGADAWLLEVKVVRITESLRTQLGIDWNVRGELAINTTQPGSVVQADAIVSMIAEAIETCFYKHISYTFFLCLFFN